MNQMINFVTFLFLFFSATYGFSQSEVSGIVKGENDEPIPLASVSIKGFNKGVKTDFDGKYSISVELSDTLTLVYYATGYFRQELLVVGRVNIDVVLVSSCFCIDYV